MRACVCACVCARARARAAGVRAYRELAPIAPPEMSVDLAHERLACLEAKALVDGGHVRPAVLSVSRRHELGACVCACVRARDVTRT